MYGLYQLALLDICMINIGSVIGIGRFWQKYNRYRYNQKLPYRYTSSPTYYSQLSVIIARQPIGDCSIRVYRSFYYTKEYHTGYFPLYCYYD